MWSYERDGRWWGWSFVRGSTQALFCWWRYLIQTRDISYYDAGGLFQCDIEIKNVPMSHNPRSGSNTEYVTQMSLYQLFGCGVGVVFCNKPMISSHSTLYSVWMTVSLCFQRRDVSGWSVGETGRSDPLLEAAQRSPRSQDTTANYTAERCTEHLASTSYHLDHGRIQLNPLNHSLSRCSWTTYGAHATHRLDRGRLTAEPPKICCFSQPQTW